MQSLTTNRAARAALAIAAVLSLGFAPAVETDAPSESSSASEAGKCLEGYAFVTINGSPQGITSTWCVKPTSCTSSVGSGPAHHGVGPVEEDHYVQIPRPGGTSQAACYL